MGVVSMRRHQDTARFHRVVHRFDRNGVRSVPKERFIREEVVPQAVDNRTRQLRNVGDLAVGRIVKQYGEDLVVVGVSLDHAETANWPRVKKDLAARDGSVCQHADVEWIAVAVTDGRAVRECVRRGRSTVR